MKKIILPATVLVLFIAILSGCSQVGKSEKKEPSNESISATVKKQESINTTMSNEDTRTSSSAETESTSELITEYKEIKQEKSDELIKQLMTKLSGSWQSSMEIVSTKVMTDYTFSPDGKLNWRQDWGLSDPPSQGAVMLKFDFPNKLVSESDDNTYSTEDSNDSSDDSSSTEDLSLLDSQQLKQLINDVKSTTLDNYLEKYGDSKNTYHLLVHDATGDQFHDSFEVKFPQSDTSIVQMSSGDWTSASSYLNDFTKK